jgi:hypothetical protein
MKNFLIAVCITTILILLPIVAKKAHAETETVLLPYSASNGNWWTGINLFNNSNYEEAFILKIRRWSDGTISKTIEETIESKGNYIIGPEDIEEGLNEPDGRFSIVIMKSDQIFITCFVGSDTGFGFPQLYTIGNSLGN